ncbi:MAG TPA: GNAT family N-acetyltransferase [Devosia sp.]|nr:GNAT family N-acetyltransferase [Devosia sp.]
MKKAKADIIEAERPVYHQGGTDRDIARLAEATHRLTMRRVRDMLPGKIETRRLVLRAPIRGDVPDLVRLADNRNVSSKLARMPSPYTRADAIGFIEIFAQRADERPYAITLDGHLIGVIGFTFQENVPPELGYWLGEPYWGQGYMTEAGRALIEAAHRTRQYDRIVAKALAGNAASLHVLDKLGFVRLGRRSRKASSGGSEVVTLELMRPRWM